MFRILKINFLGFIFYEKSPRNIKISDLDVLKNYNRKNSLFTAVTVNANNDMIDQIQFKKYTVCTIAWFMKLMKELKK